MVKIKSKKLVIVFWNLGVGGVQTRMVEVINKVVSNGGRVLVLLDNRVKNEIKLPKSLAVKVLVFSDMVLKVPKFKRPFRKIGALLEGYRRRIFFANRFIWWMVRQIWVFRPDVVLAVSNRFSAFMVVTKFLFMFLGRNFRLVINECIVTTGYLEQYERKFWRKIVRWTYPWADKIIVPTEAVKNDLVVNFGIEPKIIEVVRSWMPSNNKVQKAEKIYDGIYAGRLSEEKGIDNLVALAEEIRKRQKKYKLAVVGEGQLEKWLKKEIKKKKLEQIMNFLGYKTRGEVLKLINRSKWLLLPSRNEGLPMTVLEAYSVGVPVIVKPFLGVTEMVSKETGLISKMDKANFIKSAMSAFNGKEWGKDKQKRIMVMAEKKYSRKNLDKFVKILGG